ncbi:Ankyrin repeat protein [Phytophthora cinnamomi]|uniref:Ankyrin repeat protein n=1 Tax=Phytophthora cinnamomi TaxID=4785 RepID=UPI00355AB85F|nr:Ankyrin repeat protein [Phytophthora cinnamomi]
MAAELSAAPDRSLLAMMDEAQQRLQHLEISCRQILSPTASGGAPSPAAASDNVKLLQLQVARLQTQLLAAVERREDEDVAFRQAAQYAAAKGVANGVLHSLFDQANLGKVAELRAYLDTGSIPTRDGLRHWRLDLRTLRNEAGATLLHVAVGVSMAREKVKVKLVHLLVDRVGFDANVRDVFGQTPLHVAAMGGFQEVVQALLERGADPAARDRAGLTALSLVRTLSRPPEEVVQSLVEAENTAIRNARSGSDSIPLSKAMASALFLKGLSRFALERYSNAFSRQTTALVNALLEAPDAANIAFDQVLQERVPMLFDVLPASQVVRLDTIFANALYWDQDFITTLKLEADGYELSLVSPALSSDALSGPTWVGVLSKLIQCLKLEMADPAEGEASAVVEDSAMLLAPSSDEDVAMGEASKDCEGARAISPRRKLSISSSSTSLVKNPRAALYYADQTTCIAKTRQMWYYAVLFKASAHAFPGTLALTPESDIAISSEDVSKYFPLEDRLLIGSAEYIATDYNLQTREIHLDRKYDGKVAVTIKAYLTGSGASRLPPYVAVKRIWEREPGNKYEDQMSSEQELFQDYQFLDPESEYEVAIKLGPILNGKDARAIVAEWKKTIKQLFDARECKSGLASCEHYCPQRSGHALCLGTMAVIGQGLAKRLLGRPTFSKSLKPRASLQRLQNRFKGSEDWPGSPSSAMLATSS